MDAFDADALIYAAVPGHPLGRRVRALLEVGTPAGHPPGAPAQVGSVLLLPELLSKPRRTERWSEVNELNSLLARIELLAFDRATADLATALAARYGLHEADAAHLATAVVAGADRFVTNNRRDFPVTISEVAITYPDHLPDPVR